jgi:hypothetical protein
MTKETACVFILLCRVLLATEEQWAVSTHGQDVPFQSWQAEGAEAVTGVLVLVPAAATGPQIPSAPSNPLPTTNHQPTPANQTMTRLNVEHPTSNFQRRTKEPAGKSNIFSSTSTFDVGRSMFDVPIPSPDGETKTNMTKK